MRTTITLDDDVAALLARVRKERSLGLKEAVNEGLRHGLREIEKPWASGKPFETRVFPGRFLFPIDDVEAALVYGEGEDHR